MENESRERRTRNSQRAEHTERQAPDRRRTSQPAPAQRRIREESQNRRATEDRRAPRRNEARERNSLAAQEAERRREERKLRDSLAAQEAQRHRQERKERERLDDMREKQKRKAKHRTRRRISATVWKRLLIMGGVVAAILLSMVIFFRVHDIEIAGNSYYSPEEIIAAAGVAEGDNLLTVSRSGVAGNVMAQLPYVKSVRVTRSLPDTLVLTVTEFDATYAVLDTVGDYFLITANGKATEKVSDRDAKSHILIENLKIETPTIGQIVTVAPTQEDDLAAQGQFTALTTLLTEIENAELSKQIVSVSVPSSYDLSVWYGDRFLVKLGDTDELAYKMEFLKKVVEQQEEYASGTIDLSLREGKEAHVMLAE